MNTMPPRHREVASFQDLWHGGYYEGDPLDPHARSSYSAIDEQNGFIDQRRVERKGYEQASEIGFMSCVHVAYLACIKPYVRRGMQVLEIGPGRGAWSKAILSHNPKHLFALDALSAEHNGFWQYVGEGAPASYFKVEDMSCSQIQNDSIDFFFSFGTFCHISRSSTSEYFKNIFKKMRRNSLGFVLVSDYAKFARALGTPMRTDLETEDAEPAPGRWYHLGKDWSCDMLRRNGFDIIDEDVGVNVRDPVIKFSKAA